ncbi:MAG TPA: tRNA 2-selenouridine(34) synthase MnmH [Burkholderiales bacterium]|nr:tRNA 2-selenouridine(34) synthase MnmH [Burkholderiales bacterium]
MKYKHYDTIIDARTPGEYALDHIPGAVSAPVLNDAERAEVGTLYKQVSPFEAKKLGASLIAKNVARHIDALFRQHDKNWRPLIYCWRGGKRSGAMAHILREVGWQAETLPGGYRAYRRWVVETLTTLPAELNFTVVHGPTGSGKSRFLAALARAGAQVLDLEALARHRGSVLGGLPNAPQPTQKWFESLLLAALEKLDRRAPVYVEGESKKIGEIQVPEALMARMRASRCIVLQTDLETRVTLLLDEYRHFLAERAALEAQLDCLTALHGKEKIAQWKTLAAKGEWREFVARLLREHYDPAYQRSSGRNFPELANAPAVRIASADAFDEAAAGLNSVQRT